MGNFEFSLFAKYTHYNVKKKKKKKKKKEWRIGNYTTFKNKKRNNLHLVQQQMPSEARCGVPSAARAGGRNPAADEDMNGLQLLGLHRHAPLHYENLMRVWP